MMNSDPIGEMNERITIQSATKTSDGLGGFTTTWSDVYSLWAKAWSVSSRESTIDMQMQMTRTQKFKIWYRSGFSSAWRILWNSRYFNITAVDPDQERKFLFLTCEEIL